MGKSGETDEELMLAYQAGDARAFEELFERYKGRIYNYFVRHWQDWAVAEDLFQKTFLRVHEARSRYRPTASFATWIYTIATNLLRDEARKEKARSVEPITTPRTAEGVGARPAGGTASPERAASLGELRNRIVAAVRALPAEQKEAFILGKYEGRSYREIAEILGCSEGAVKVRIHRAIKFLRAALGEIVYAM